MKKIFFTVTLIVLLSPLIALAQTSSNGNLGYTPLEPIPGVTTNATGGAITFPQLLANMFSIGITIGALLAVLMLTIGGIQYMVSEAVPNKTAGLSRARSALWGILLIAMSWLILHTINPQLLTFSLNPCPAGSGGCTITPGAANTSQQSASVQTISASSYQAQTDSTQLMNPIEYSSQNSTNPSVTAASAQFMSDCTGIQHGEVIAETDGSGNTIDTCIPGPGY